MARRCGTAPGVAALGRRRNEAHVESPGEGKGCIVRTGSDSGSTRANSLVSQCRTDMRLFKLRLEVAV